MSASPELLIVATSGRALAESARRAGWRPRVIDAFADADTRAAADAVAAVPLGAAGLDAEAVIEAADRLCPPGAGAALIYGSGLESRPALLAALARGRTLLGNAPAVAGAARDPRSFFGLLDALGIPHPEVSFEPSAGGSGWLLKHAGGSGGGHIRRLRTAPHRLPPGAYLQREVGGQAMSLLFLADGRQAWPIGFNTLRTTGAGDRPYRYGGVVNRASLAPAQRLTVRRAAEALTRRLGLRGLNGLDFISAGGRCLLLELNPRPGASFELYDPDAPQGLLAWHADACRGRMRRPGLARTSRVRALSIVYAPAPVHIPAAFDWPPWCRDRPVGGQTIPAGEPVCTVLAEAEDGPGVERWIRARRAGLLPRLLPHRHIA